jgi:hypothetical protein
MGPSSAFFEFLEILILMTALQEKIAKDPNTHGSMFVPGVLGSDKTTVSVGTGNTEFYPFYSGIGNIYNSTRCAHREGLALTAFLNIPKSKSSFACLCSLLTRL